MNKWLCTALLAVIPLSVHGQTLFNNLMGKTFYNNEHNIELTFGFRALTASELRRTHSFDLRQSTPTTYVSLTFAPLRGGYYFHGYITENGFIALDYSDTNVRQQFQSRDGTVFWLAKNHGMQAEYDRQRKILSIRFENNVVVLFDDEGRTLQ
jgi:hypothetical protein